MPRQADSSQQENTGELSCMTAAALLPPLLSDIAFPLQEVRLCAAFSQRKYLHAEALDFPGKMQRFFRIA